MSKQPMDASAHMGGTPQSAKLFPVERNMPLRYRLKPHRHSHVLPKSESIGVIGIDGKEYPIPPQEQVVGLFDHNRELVGRKVPQWFERLELTPMAMPTPLLIDLMKTAILKHAAEGKRLFPWCLLGFNYEYSRSNSVYCSTSLSAKSANNIPRREHCY